MQVTITTTLVLALMYVKVVLATAQLEEEVSCHSCCSIPAGMPGTPGIPGNHGPYGPIGPKGDAGSPGVGVPGVKGDKGSDGLMGEPGATGERGLKGEQGVGQPGKQGHQGLPGLAGLKGESGVPGPAGLQGQKGEFGIRTRRPAFTVVKKTFSSSVNSVHFPFDDAIFREEGTDFDLSNGTFTCNVSGTYVFMFSFCKISTSSALYVLLMKNDQYIVSAQASGTGYKQVSNSAVVSLQQGDRVYVTVSGGVHSSDLHYISFTGFLLYKN